MIKTQVHLDSNQPIKNDASTYLKKAKPPRSRFSWSQRAKKASTKMGGNISLNIDKELY